MVNYNNNYIIIIIIIILLLLLLFTTNQTICSTSTSVYMHDIKSLGYICKNLHHTVNLTDSYATQIVRYCTYFNHIFYVLHKNKIFKSTLMFYIFISREFPFWQKDFF